jgi:hypothetical protein
VTATEQSDSNTGVAAGSSSYCIHTTARLACVAVSIPFESQRQTFGATDAA